MAKPPTQEELDAQREELNIQQALSETVIKGNAAITEKFALLDESHGLGKITSELYNKQIDALQELEGLYKTSGKEAIRALQLTINVAKEDLKASKKRSDQEKKFQEAKKKGYKLSKDILNLMLINLLL